jgi:tetratricopeptide (TPR) repeat protein
MITVRFPWQRVVWIALLLCAWAPFKLVWEVNIEQQQNQLRYHGVVMTRQLRDQLTQGLSIGILAGMRNIVADFIWIQAVTEAWEKYEWFKMDSLINLCTSLEPRSIEFWDFGGWQLAWNVSIAAKLDVVREPNPLRRLHDYRFWVYKGLDVYQRGIENNPRSYELWRSMGELYQNRLGDYRDAAAAYQRASELPGAPVYLERLQGYMLYDAGDYQAAIDAWKALWNRLTPAQREEKQHWKEKILSEIRKNEDKLHIPPEKRFFPK